MQKVRGHPEGLPLFVGMRFQVLFHSPLGVLFTFPSRYSFTIGQQVVLSLGGWSPQIPSGLHVAGSTQEHHLADSDFRIRGYHPVSPTFPGRSANLGRTVVVGPTTPPQKPGTVWAGPRSLAATDGVTVVFLSSGY